MTKPMISVAGIRGTIGGSLLPHEFYKLAAAFFSTIENRLVVLGGDTRPSYKMVRHLVLAAASATGCHVYDLGVCPTPTVGFMVNHLGAGGGVAITASHNPIEWNALKFFSEWGTFLTAQQMDAVLLRYKNEDFDLAQWDQLGHVTMQEAPVRPHLEKVLENVDVDAIRKRRFSVVLDLCNGAGLALLPELLYSLNCNVEIVHGNPRKAFERVPEPLPENLAALCAKVRKTHAHLGFAVDPDADRLALVDEKGHPIGEERTLTLAARSILREASESRENLPPLVANLSTTRALDDVAEEFNTRVLRTRIGEANVVEAIQQSGALIGGEGNGGVIYPTVHPGRDAATGIALILQELARTGLHLSALNDEVPDYVMVKKKADIEGKVLENILAALREQFVDAEFDDTDGLKMLYPDAWVHVRPSGTEPILRVFAEAPDQAQAKALADKALDIAES